MWGNRKVNWAILSQWAIPFSIIIIYTQLQAASMQEKLTKNNRGKLQFKNSHMNVAKVKDYFHYKTFFCNKVALDV